jgi:hypothetical protein
MSRFRKVLLALGLCTVVAVTGIAVNTSAVTAHRQGGMPVVSDGTGGDIGVTQRLSTKDGGIALVASGDFCRTVFYGDGANMFRACSDHFDQAGDNWTSESRLVWNIPFSQGGHSDEVQAYCDYASSACGDFIADGDTETLNTDRVQGTDTTMWITVIMDYPVVGGPDYCRRVFWTHAGTSSVTAPSMATCGW